MLRTFWARAELANVDDDACAAWYRTCDRLLALERKRATGTGKRVLYTEERLAFSAKNRYSLPPVLPLDWNAFVDAQNGPMPVSKLVRGQDLLVLGLRIVP